MIVIFAYRKKDAFKAFVPRVKNYGYLQPGFSVQKKLKMKHVLDRGFTIIY